MKPHGADEESEPGRTKGEQVCYYFQVPNIRKCIVKFRDGEGVEHAVEVAAASLYEAAALELQRFRRCEWSREPSFEAGTLEIEVWDEPTLHRVKITELDKWLNRDGGKPRDVALDCRAFNYSRGIPLAEIVRGDGFIINGKIFPAGTLRPGNDLNDPGSIGDWVSRGTSTATLAEHVANPESIGIFSTNYYLLNDGRALVSEGWFKPAGVGRAAITGGMGAFSGTSGEVSGVNISTNSTGCPNTRFKFNIQPGSVGGASNN
jgi:hypothetical protein